MARGYPAVSLVQETARFKREMRNPAHPFYVRTAPFVITPFCFAPVLPGETMKNMLMQARVVTDPINNPLMGWWTEFMFFYVKLSDLYERDDVRELLLNPQADLGTFTTAVGTTDDPFFYYEGGAQLVNWQKLCHRVIVDHYFRNEGETYATSAGLYDDSGETNPVVGAARPMAYTVGESVIQSAYLSDTIEGTTNDPVIETINEAGAATVTITAREVREAMQRYDMEKLYNLTQMSWEDYLAAQGLSVPNAVEHRPELLRHIREWQYPTNTIDPTNGTPRSAVSWSIRERADKARAFKEPGFIMGITVTRPKVYFSAVDGSFASAMSNYKTWLPSFLRQADPTVSLRELAHDQGPLKDVVTDTDGYWFDVADLLNYGEQWLNLGVTSAQGFTVNTVALPNAALTNKRYVTHAEVEAMFVNGSTGKFGVNMDGVVNFQIACSPHNPIVDATPIGGRNQGETSGGF